MSSVKRKTTVSLKPFLFSRISAGGLFKHSLLYFFVLSLVALCFRVMIVVVLNVPGEILKRGHALGDTGALSLERRKKVKRRAGGRGAPTSTWTPAGTEGGRQKYRSRRLGALWHGLHIFTRLRGRLG